MLVLVSAITGVIAACGSSDDSTFADENANQDGGGNGSSGGNFGNGSSGGDGDGDGGSTQTLRIDPPVLTVTIGGRLAAPTGGGNFTAHLGTDPKPVTAKWSIDDIRYGTIDQTGAFTGKPIGGKTKVRARVGNVEALAEVEVKVVISEDFANLSDDQKTKLRAGGNADSGFKWLYPYDRTVFPRGLPAPTLQFAGAAPTAYRVRLKTSRMDVEGFYSNKPGSAAARVGVAEAWWHAVTLGTEASESVEVEVTKISGNSVTGPRKETWHVAPGSLRGSIFYNSYNSNKAYPEDPNAASGAILALRAGTGVLDVLSRSARIPGNTSDTYCVVCHSVSANGTRLVTGIGWSDKDPDNSNPSYSGVYNINAAGKGTLARSDAEGRRFAFGALSPDGKWMLSNAVGGGVRGLSGTYPSKLIDVATGNEVAGENYFNNASRTAVTPTFAPDGKRIAYNDGTNDWKNLVVANFNGAATPPAVTGAATVYTTTENRIGWPSFIPDGNAILAHVGSRLDTEVDATANLVWIDIATKKARLLDSLNGKSGGSSYLPFADDQNKNYEPTLLPVAVGGYYWVVFTSRRSFGNTIYDGSNSVNSAGDKPYEKGEGVAKGIRKKLWVAAIDINRTANADISHPAFYLEGQELRAGNMRGFWALDPCKADGATCAGGDECCNGFCRNVEQSNGSVVAQCVPPPASCANESERCNVDADCCNAPSGTKCLNNVCTTPGPSVPK